MSLKFIDFEVQSASRPYLRDRSRKWAGPRLSRLQREATPFPRRGAKWQWRLVIHAPHATARRHSSRALRFRPVGYHRLGGNQQSRNRAGILQRYPHDLGRIDNPGLHHVLVLARLCVKPEIRVVLVGQLADHDRALDPGILGDLTYRRLDGLSDDLDADLLVVVRGV